MLLWTRRNLTKAAANPTQCTDVMPQTKQTLSMQQYLAIKSQYPERLLLYQVGDFYELFHEDAKKASQLLNITLTSRNRSDENPVPMAGVPIHSAESYIAKLVKLGQSIVICDQIGDTKTTKGLVKREITRVITPGTLTEETLLQERKECLLVSIYHDQNIYGIATLELSSGQFVLSECNSKTVLDSELERLRPSEILLAEDQRPIAIDRQTTARPSWHFDYSNCYSELCKQMQTHSLAGFGCQNMPQAICAAGAALYYLKETQKSALPHLTKLSVEEAHDYIGIDAESRKYLEIDASLSGHNEQTLVHVYNQTSSTMGSRRLRRWLGQPLRSHQRINNRLDAIAWLLDYGDIPAIVQLLSKISDLERITARLALLTARPRDLLGIRETLAVLPTIQNLLKANDSNLLQKINTQLDVDQNIVEKLATAITDNPPATIRDGGVIKAGFDKKLDELRDLSRNADQYILNLETEEKKRSQITNLRIAYNKIHGYYIELPRAQSAHVPADYQRVQTLKHVERFTIAALREFQGRILTAQTQALAHEKLIYRELLESFLPQLEQLKNCANALATLDVLVGLARCAQLHRCCRPQFSDQIGIKMTNARHPITEQIMSEKFIPNDLWLDEKRQLLIITGPNMGGKSTYMRQTALIVLLAHIGAYVPAEKIIIGPIDRIFTRIGASDDISSGRSTFMVEMTETANILNNATQQSLVLIDEIGRGTSTFDGMSLAWSCAAHLAEINHSLTLFATHYFELTSLAEQFNVIHNAHLDAMEHKDKIVFLYQVKEGPASKSYGLQVARLAGIPQYAITLAKQKLQELEMQETQNSASQQIALDLSTFEDNQNEDKQNTLANKQIIELLSEINPDSLTPRSALEKLYELKRQLK